MGRRLYAVDKKKGSSLCGVEGGGRFAIEGWQETVFLPSVFDGF
ncbi:protein of unknown function [Methylacidimicrobium sp. AP8]|nr:protein of unknown function [Methylacidimicrobium sp. AP8]